MAGWCGLSCKTRLASCWHFRETKGTVSLLYCTVYSSHFPSREVPGLNSLVCAQFCTESDGKQLGVSLHFQVVQCFKNLIPVCLCPYLKISLTDLEAAENFTKNTRWPVSKYKLENKDKKGTLHLRCSSLHLSGEHLIMPDGELDPADDNTWDSLHPLSSRGLLTLGKPLPTLDTLRAGQGGQAAEASCHPRILTNRSFASGFTDKTHEKENFSRKGSKPHNPAYK